MEKKIESLLTKLPEIERELGLPGVTQDQKRFRELTQEHAYLSEIKENVDLRSKLQKEYIQNKDLLKGEADAEIRALVEEDNLQLQKKLEELQTKIETLLVPPDPHDSTNTIMELRAGTGGDEAALFVGDCVRMYKCFADQMGWHYELLSCTESEMGGYKEFVMVLSGKNVHRILQYEGGTHRVQRVPETEAQGRVHTSAITIAVLMEPGEEEEIVVIDKDLRIDTYRSSGAGGQHVNTTDSAVRITHLPTGIVVWCQEEKSQHKNKEKAFRFLKAKLAEHERRKKEAEIAALRGKQVGSGDRSERIRTYNFPQNRVTDHRINLTLYNLDRILDGDLGTLTTALINHFHQEKLSSCL